MEKKKNGFAIKSDFLTFVYLCDDVIIWSRKVESIGTAVQDRKRREKIQEE